jgi:hypothetical protein
MIYLIKPGQKTMRKILNLPGEIYLKLETEFNFESVKIIVVFCFMLKIIKLGIAGFKISVSKAQIGLIIVI